VNVWAVGFIEGLSFRILMEKLEVEE